MSQLDSQQEARSEILRVRAAFVEKTWIAVTLVCVLAAIGIPLRTLLLSRAINGGVVVAVLVAACQITAFVFRRRLSSRLYEWVPVGIVLVASAVATLTLGLQGNGITYFIVGNILVAMLCSRKVVNTVFLVTVTILVLAAAGFVSGVVDVRFSPGYASNGVVWAYAIITVATLSYSIITGISYFRDSMQHLTEQVIAQREEIAMLANHDALTGLPSLRLSRDRLAMACGRASRENLKAAVLYVDLDGFKAVNDTMGHDCGDQVLKTIALRLAQNIRAVDTAARIGGDEFMVVLSGIESQADAERVAAKLLQSISEPIPVGLAGEREAGASTGQLPVQQTAQVGASIGIALFPDHADSAETMLTLADKAMYSVKRAAKNNYALADPVG